MYPTCHCNLLNPYKKCDANVSMVLNVSEEVPIEAPELVQEAAEVRVD